MPPLTTVGQRNHFLRRMVVAPVRKESIMAWFVELSAYFWLLFTLVVSVAVLRELRRHPE
jgi:hypothetical protein